MPATSFARLRHLGRCAALVACLVASLAPLPALAVDINPRQYAYSNDPFYKIGNINAELSKLCRLGSFNQHRIGEYFTAFGGDSRNIVGIAKKNYNLFDPTAKADPSKTYHFFNDGTSQCRVYVAP